MRLYIWEGDGISDAYHNDGTLVVLAESPEQARLLVRPWPRARRGSWHRAFTNGGWDGTDEALDREPDRIIDVGLGIPTIVAFNGGGYD